MEPQKVQKTVWNSEQVLALVRSFYAADKPPEITTHDIDLVVLLMSYKALDHYATHSIETLARYLRKDTKTIRKSMLRLSDLGWLHLERREGASSGIMLITDKLPMAEVLDHKVTDAAKELAKTYQQAVVILGIKDKKQSKKRRRRQSTKRWLEAQYYNAQNILNKCDGDSELAGQMLHYAFNHPRFVQIAKKSLYCLFKYWKGLENMYSQHLQAAHAKEVTQ
jgi:hypothetical protein